MKIMWPGRKALEARIVELEALYARARASHATEERWRVAVEDREKSLLAERATLYRRNAKGRLERVQP